MKEGFSNFLLLFWKNWTSTTILSRCLCYLGVISMFLVLLCVRQAVNITDVPVISYEPLPLSTIGYFQEAINKAIYAQSRSNLTVKMPRFQLLYSPKNEILDKIVGAASRSLNLQSPVAVKNAASLQSEMLEKNYLAGVQFDDSIEGITDYPDKISFALRFPYKLRTTLQLNEMTWQTERLFLSARDQVQGPRNPADVGGGVPGGYFQEGFLPVQHEISVAYLKLKSQQENLPDIYLRRYPHKEHQHDVFDMFFTYLMLAASFGFAHLAGATAALMMYEKEQQTEEVLKIMGMKAWVSLIAWLCLELLEVIVLSALITGILKVKIAGKTLLKSSGFLVTWLLLIVYGIVTASFCLLLGVLVSNSKLIGSIFTAIWMFSAIFSNYRGTYSHGVEIMISLLISNVGWSDIWMVAGHFERYNVGVQWSNIFTPVLVDRNTTIGPTLLILLASSVVVMLLYWYLEQLFPGPFGVPKKWNFLFNKKVWSKNQEIENREPDQESMAKKRTFQFNSKIWSKKRNMENRVPENREMVSRATETREMESQETIYLSVDTSSENLSNRVPTAFEQEPLGKVAGVQVIDLKKQFGKHVVVKGVTMNMYEGEITVLLGHNGAGKTTTISMLTGMFPPSAGTARIHGDDIRTDLAKARKSLGICPQQNVLFDGMSVKNHIKFYCRLKGIKQSETIRAEVDKFLALTKLEYKKNTASSKLSGGQKRKLSVCCALCGDTKVVFLDEPSSGMDPAARRELWSLLQSEKDGRTILLTTHYMDEADTLGDRIAIMNDGKMQCYGTSFFLKKQFGSGYHLICAKQDDCSESDVTALVVSTIPGARLESNSESELSYHLPDKQLPYFSKLFRSLEGKLEKLRLGSFGISVSSMEEVFMNIGAETLRHDRISQQRPSNVDDCSPPKKCSCPYLGQWRAMFLKRILYTWRDWFILLAQLIYVVVFGVVIFARKIMSPKSDEPGPMQFSLTQYRQAVTVLHVSPDVEDNSREWQIAKNYEGIASSYGSSYSFESTLGVPFMDYILGKQRANEMRVSDEYLAAATVSNNILTAWFNNQPLHTAPLALNLLHNAMAKTLIGDSSEITVFNSPLPKAADDSVGGQDISRLDFPFNSLWALSLVMPYFLILIVRERVSGAKLQELIAGVQVLTYWLSHFLFDLAVFLLLIVIFLGVVLCFQAKYFSTLSELQPLFILFLCFGLATLPVIYFTSFFWVGIVSAIPVLTILLLLPGALALMLGNFVGDWLEKTIFYPPAALVFGINYIYVNTFIREYCDEGLAKLSQEQRCALEATCCEHTPYFAEKRPGIGREVRALLLVGLLFSLLLLVVEYNVFRTVYGSIRHMWCPPPRKHGSQDDDVANEAQQIKAMSPKERREENLVLDGATKYYGRNIAVNSTSLSVKPKECFGLLGANGAGKTSTFKMITGDTSISHGNAYVKGKNLRFCLSRTYSEIGYCPQFDSLFLEFTGRETLRIYCLSHGLRSDTINYVIEKLAHSFGFTAHLDKKTKKYSGGNRRKLSVALAVLHRPSVVLLDEPSTGIDPDARRQLWNIIAQIRDCGASVVLTSHSMEECEALCTSVAIMVNGQLVCVGSPQHLKSKFAKGLVLQLKVKKSPNIVYDTTEVPRKSQNMNLPQVDENVLRAKEFVLQHFPRAVLGGVYEGLVTYKIPYSEIKWSDIFDLMQQNRDHLELEDFNISQSTLEDVFLEFAKLQGKPQKRVCCC